MVEASDAQIRTARSDFLDENFYDFLWFKLYVGSAIALSITAVVVFLLFFTGQFFNLSALGILEWLPVPVIYSEMYLLPCCLLERHRGRGRYGSTFKASPLTRIATVVWAMAFVAGGVASTLGFGFVPPYDVR